MSAIGFDVGNDASCVALARKRGIDVLLNKESKRETFAGISFGDKQRFLGTDAAAKQSMNPKNTVHQLKRLLGKRFDDPDLQADVAKLPFKVQAGEDGGVRVVVTYCGEPAVFTPEQLLAMVLVDLKRIAEEESGVPATDCCISVPAYFTEAERFAMLNAATIAGVNCLRLINDTTATALAYGIYKTDLPETDPVHVAFVDVGYAATQVSIVSLKRSGLAVKSHAWDRNLGGRDFDEVLFDHFAAEFKQKTKLDVTTNAKSCYKLRLQCEKVKKILSANTEAAIAVECLMDEMDMRSTVTRDKFEEMAAPLLSRFTAPLEAALEASGLTKTDISSVEIVGSSTRVPALYRMIETFFGQMHSRTLNAKEVVCRGCALQCAMLSPMLKVREYEVVDACPYAVAVTYEKDGQPATQVLFEKCSPFPAVKAVTFMRAEPFQLAASYVDDPRLPATMPRQLGTYTIGPFKVPDGADKAKIKVFVRMNLHGLLNVEQAQSYEEQEETVEQPAVDQPGSTNGPAPMDAEAGEQAAASDAAAAAEPASAKRKRVIKHEVPVAGVGTPGFGLEAVNKYFEAEGQMQAADKLQEDTNEAKNALEEYIYSLRNKLYGELTPFVREADKEGLVAQLTAMEDWLYDEGEDETKSVYVGKLQELKRVGGPIEERAAEDASRPGAIDELKRAADGYLGIASSELPAHQHLSPDDRATLAKEANGALSWLSEKVALQAQVSKHDNPVLVVADINKKRDVLDRVCKPIATKPAPPPAAKSPAKSSPAADEGDGAAPMDADDAPAAEEQPGGEPMQQ